MEERRNDTWLAVVFIVLVVVVLLGAWLVLRFMY
jgi:ABC-type transporter Mla subunit MlaD